MNRILRSVVVVMLGSLVFGCHDRGTPEPARKSSTMRIGVITTLTGEAGAYGKYTRQGLELGVADLSPAPVELVYKDSKGDPMEAVRVFKELQREGVPVVIGPFTSTEVRVVGAEAERAGVTLITTSATADDLSTLGPHVFMMLPPNSQQGSDQAKYALSRFSAKTAAILYRQNPYGETLRAGFSKTFEQAGGKITADMGFPDGEEDFRDRLRRIMATTPDVVFIPVHDADTGRILRQAKEINLPAAVRFLGADGCMSDTALKLAGQAGEGAVFSNVASISKAFDDKYRSAHSEEPSPYAASAYDTVRIVAQLATKGAKTSDDFQRGLVEMTGFDGATGTTKFSKKEKSYWALSKPYHQFEIKAGKFVLVP